MQGEYLDRARKFVDDRYGERRRRRRPRDVLDRWESVLTRLASDPMQLAGELDWVAKLRLLEGYRDRDGLDWDSPRLQLVDLQYADVRPEKGLYHRLVARGAMQTLLARRTPRPRGRRTARRTPGPTSAASACAATGTSVAAASWDSVIFDVGRESLVRVPMLEPLRGTKAHVGELLDRCPTRPTLVDAARRG